MTVLFSRIISLTRENRSARSSRFLCRAHGGASALLCLVLSFSCATGEEPALTDAASRGEESASMDLTPRESRPPLLDISRAIAPVDQGELSPLDAQNEPADALSSRGEDQRLGADAGAPEPAVNCALISDANPRWELCSETPDQCAGVFTDGAGCQAYCAAAGLICAARFGGEPGCQQEPENPISCDANNGHESDWCLCERPSPGAPAPTPDPPPAPVDPQCPSDPNTPPIVAQLGLRDAQYTQRHNWVLSCYDYAYTARGEEHEACDPEFRPDGSRHGTAIFRFSGIPQGRYDVMIGSRHTENRNPAGALFLVNGEPRLIDQRVQAPERVWELHGTYCLSGEVEVTLDSTVNGGSDSVLGVRLEPH